MHHGRAVCSEDSWNRTFIPSLLGVPLFACSLHVVNPIVGGFIMVDKSLKVHMEFLGANQKLRLDLFSSRTHHCFWEATSSTWLGVGPVNECHGKVQQQQQKCTVIGEFCLLNGIAPAFLLFLLHYSPKKRKLFRQK